MKVRQQLSVEVDGKFDGVGNSLGAINSHFDPLIGPN